MGQSFFSSSVEISGNMRPFVALTFVWDALSALPLMWPSLGDTLAMPDLDLLEFTVLVMPQLLLLEFMGLVMPQLLLLPQPLSLPQLPTELSTTPPAPLSPMPQ